MGLLPAPSFMGLFVVGATNNTISYKETNGVTPVTSTGTIVSGSYYPDSVSGPESLATIIGDQMTANSAYGATYVCSVDTADGNVRITATGGTLTGFYLMLTTAETNKFLTGGDAGAAAQGLDHFGFLVKSAYDAPDLTVVSDTQVCNSWWPQGPISGQTTISGKDLSYRKHISQVQTLNHTVKSRAWSARIPSTSTDPSEVLKLSFQFLSATDRTNFQKYFWSTYAFTGAKIRYFLRRTDLSDYEERHVWQESGTDFAPTRLEGYPHYNNTLFLKRWTE